MLNRACSWISCMIVASGCTNADLQLFVDPDDPLLRLSIDAQVCAPPAVEEEVPYKILFVVDTSGSTSTSDPTPPGGYSRREKAVRLAISEHANQENVAFGIITFSSEPRRQTYGFTRDPETLNGAAANIGTSQGGTNYSDTLWTAIDFILGDLRDQPDAVARRTTYMLFWLSDGEPTVGVSDPSAITPGVTYLSEWLAEHAAGFVFNSYFIGGAQDDPGGVAKAKTLLADMASRGGGDFINVEAGAGIDLNIDPTPMLRQFQLLDAFAANLATHFGPHHPLADSDLDGLLDEAEIELGTDPRLQDTDGDGIRDGLEVAAGESSPLVDDVPCTDRSDNDGDGLSSCEELWLGSADNAPDSDFDGILDGSEMLLGGFPLTADRDQDADLDGLGNVYELRAHLDVRAPNTQEHLSRWEYRYQVQPSAEMSATQPCYRLTVENIGLFETQQSETGNRGDNPIEVVATFGPVDGGDERIYMRYAETVQFRLPDIREPVDGTLRPTAEQFVQLQRR